MFFHRPILFYISVIEIKALEKHLSGHKVLDKLNLKIEKGKTCVIIGRSGCGKSVLLKHIVGIMKPDAGSVFVDGKEVNKLKDAQLDQVRLKVGMVFQGGALFDSMTVGENVGFGLIEHQHLDKKEIEKRVGQSLNMVGLFGIEDLMPSQLSGGMKKRV
ncbi:ATP-binding cassette domain-containing protein, partial [bacterium]